MISALFPASNNYQNLSLLIEVFQNSKAKQGAQGPELWSYCTYHWTNKKKRHNEKTVTDAQVVTGAVLTKGNIQTQKTPAC